ncbi:unnamed protein product [Thlaspi arvense]|uniref:NADH-quinone oxidoreductase subunit D domain-containing protein n=1 Tax=Thlaspi arvense TaxID=13288 RepID=A0AAU9RVG5_THLAR|nr:unnamed protein product [Thlaspi arvense]
MNLTEIISKVDIKFRSFHFIVKEKMKKAGDLLNFQIQDVLPFGIARKIFNRRGVDEKVGETQHDCWLMFKKNRVQRIKEKLMKRPVTGKDPYDSQYGTSPPICMMARMLLTVNPYWVIYIEEWKKIAENRAIIQYLPYVTRWDYLATMFTEAITVNGPEQLGNIQVPKRASYIRLLICYGLALLWQILGHRLPFLFFREREFVYDLFEAATGMRKMHNFFRIGGIAADLPYGWIDKCLDFCDYFLTENGLKALGLLVGKKQ